MKKSFRNISIDMKECWNNRPALYQYIGERGF